MLLLCLVLEMLEIASSDHRNKDFVLARLLLSQKMSLQHQQTNLNQLCEFDLP